MRSSCLWPLWLDVKLTGRLQVPSKRLSPTAGALNLHASNRLVHSFGESNAIASTKTRTKPLAISKNKYGAYKAKANVPTLELAENSLAARGNVIKADKLRTRSQVDDWNAYKAAALGIVADPPSTEVLALPPGRQTRRLSESRVVNAEYASTQEEWTCADIHKTVVRAFKGATLSYGQATLNAYDEATFLITVKLGYPVQEPLENYFDEVIPLALVRDMFALVEKRIRSRKPLAYLLKTCFQQGLEFYIDERALIPRSLLGEVLAYNRKDKTMSGKPAIKTRWDEELPEIPSSTVTRILDMCTGSASLAILAAVYFPRAHTVHAVDITPDALAIATMNLKRHKLTKRVKLFEGNGFDALRGPQFLIQAESATPMQYDLIVCNPPYVSHKVMSKLPKEYTYEPELAFAGGVRGIDLVSQLLYDAPTFLSDSGYLLLEVGRAGKVLITKYPEIFGAVDQVTSTKSFAVKQSKKGLESGVDMKETAVRWLPTETASGPEVLLASKACLLRLRHLMESQRKEKRARKNAKAAAKLAAAAAAAATVETAAVTSIGEQP